MRLSPLQKSLVSQAGHPCRQVLVLHKRKDLLKNFVIPVKTSTFVTVPITNIIEKAVLITTPNNKYIVKQPNNLEHN